ncbi:MAG TPA: LemA family protein [Gemmatimonadaceae bacterium]|nr:LemA family protein [Gemmatimonadaceae bacterium]
MKARWMIALVPLVMLTTGCGYNRIQELDENAAAQKSQIEVQLQRRADLIPNLVQTVQRFAQQEEAIFTNVANARAGLLGAIRSGDPQQMADANAAVGSALGRLLAIAEAYPELKSDQTFIRLQDELAGTENRIAVSRRDYNEAVQQYNTLLRRFPTNLTAKVIGADEREYYEVSDPANREAPSVEFAPPGKS